MGGGDSRDLATLCLGGDDAHTALMTGERSVSWSELRSLVASRVRAFAEEGLPPRRFVPVSCSDTLETVVTTLAVWRHDCVAVPLDGALSAAARTRALARLASPCEHPQAALLLFTSGSSGEPKAVLLGAHGILANVAAILDYLPVATAARVGLCSPLFYSYGLLGQAVATLAARATLVDLLAESSVEAQIARIREAGVRGISSVPTHLRRLALWLEEKDETLSLSYCGIAGASLDAHTKSLLLSRFGACELFHQYGLTEASPRVTAISSSDAQFDAGSVGRALRGIEIQVRSEGGAALSPREVGDVHVDSPSVMIAYYGDEEATRRAIGPDGFLRTGDRGFVDEEGYLFIEGRSDGVVKCGGERVGLESVASVIRALGGVREAAVVAIPHAELGHALVAFVESDLPVPKLRAELRELLLPAQRPSRVIALASLPRTPNGKIAFSELRALAQSPKEGP